MDNFRETTMAWRIVDLVNSGRSIEKCTCMRRLRVNSLAMTAICQCSVGSNYKFKIIYPLYLQNQKSLSFRIFWKSKTTKFSSQWLKIRKFAFLREIEVYWYLKSRLKFSKSCKEIERKNRIHTLHAGFHIILWLGKFCSHRQQTPPRILNSTPGSNKTLIPVGPGGS